MLPVSLLVDVESGVSQCLLHFSGCHVLCLCHLGQITQQSCGCLLVVGPRLYLLAVLVMAGHHLLANAAADSLAQCCVGFVTPLALTFLDATECSLLAFQRNGLAQFGVGQVASLYQLIVG